MPKVKSTETTDEASKRKNSTPIYAIFMYIFVFIYFIVCVIIASTGIVNLFLLFSFTLLFTSFVVARIILKNNKRRLAKSTLRFCLSKSMTYSVDHSIEIISLAIADSIVNGKNLQSIKDLVLIEFTKAHFISYGFRVGVYSNLYEIIRMPGNVDLNSYHRIVRQIKEWDARGERIAKKLNASVRKESDINDLLEKVDRHYKCGDERFERIYKDFIESVMIAVSAAFSRRIDRNRVSDPGKKKVSELIQPIL